MVYELLFMNHLSLLYFPWMWAIFFFFFSFFFFLWHALWACGIPSLCMHLFFSLSLFFHCHAMWACGIPSLGMHLLFIFVQPASLMVISERGSQGVTWSFILWWMEMLAIFQCRSIAYEWTCTCTWSWSLEYEKFLTLVVEFDKAQSKRQAAKGFSWCSNFGSGRILY